MSAVFKTNLKHLYVQGNKRYLLEHYKCGLLHCTQVIYVYLWQPPTNQRKIRQIVMKSTKISQCGYYATKLNVSQYGQLTVIAINA